MDFSRGKVLHHWTNSYINYCLIQLKVLILMKHGISYDRADVFVTSSPLINNHFTGCSTPKPQFTILLLLRSCHCSCAEPMGCQNGSSAQPGCGFNIPCKEQMPSTRYPTELCTPVTHWAPMAQSPGTPLRAHQITEPSNTWNLDLANPLSLIYNNWVMIQSLDLGIIQGLTVSLSMRVNISVSLSLLIQESVENIIWSKYPECFKGL